MSKDALIITDLDGTLIDSESLNFDCYMKAFREHGYEIDWEAARIVIRGGHYQHFIPELLGKDCSAEEIRSIRNCKSEIYMRNVSLLRLNLGLLNLLERSKRFSVISLVTSAGTDAVQNIFSHFGLTSLFDIVITGDDVQAKKPSPEGFLRAIAMSGVALKKVIIFEDSKVGLQAARNAGVEPIQISFD